MWLRAAFACHGIFQQCFLAMFRSSKKNNIHEKSMAALLNSLSADIVEASDDPACAADHGAAFVVPDIQPSKVEGVRAKKACLYIERPESLPETFISVVATDALERYMYWLFKTQEEELWLDKDPAARPLLNLTSLSQSPVLMALYDYTQAVFSSAAETPVLCMMRGAFLCE